MIDIERVDFISVATRDAARASRFYGEPLGLPASHRDSGEFEVSNVTLGLWEPEAEGIEFRPNEAGIAPL